MKAGSNQIANPGAARGLSAVPVPVSVALMPDARYILRSQPTELRRLRLQAEVWEPAGHSLLETLQAPEGARALDVGCGSMGWLPLLDQWVGERGHAIGADVDDAMLAAAGALAEQRALRRVDLVNDDLFATRLPAGEFDLVHARFQLTPLGRHEEQVAIYRRLVKPGGVIVLEDPDHSTWTFEPPATATERLIELIVAAFAAAGGDFDAGLRGAELLAREGIEPNVRRTVLALPPEHPYLRLPLEFAQSLRGPLTELEGEAHLDALIAEAEGELASPRRVGRTFTLVQTYGTAP
jgi:SAM-dependent methyltransferase